MLVLALILTITTRVAWGGSVTSTLFKFGSESDHLVPVVQLVALGDTSAVVFALFSATNISTHGAPPSALYRSLDSGESFDSLNVGVGAPLPSNLRADMLVQSPSNANTLSLCDAVHRIVFTTPDAGDRWTSTPVPIAPARLHFHPQFDQMMLVSDTRAASNNFLLSRDRGTSFTSLSVGDAVSLLSVKWAASAVTDQNGASGSTRIVALYVTTGSATTTTTSSSKSAGCLGYSDDFGVTLTPTNVCDVVEMTLGDGLLLASVATPTTSTSLWVSTSTHQLLSAPLVLQRALLPPNIVPSSPVQVLSAAQSITFIHTNGTLLASTDTHATHFVKSLACSSLDAFAQVAHGAIPGLYLVTCDSRTFITRDKGAFWLSLGTPDGTCVPPRCSLTIDTLHSVLASQTGIVLARAHSSSLPLPSSSSSSSSLYVSSDGSNNFFNSIASDVLPGMINRGGALLAINASTVPTALFRYSLDYGVSWSVSSVLPSPIASQQIVSLGDVSTSTLVVGTTGDGHWAVVKVNFAGALGSVCTATELESYTAGTGQSMCLLGQSQTLLRPSPLHPCHDSRASPLVLTSVFNCSCQASDFACAYGYYRDDASPYCLPLPGIQPTPPTPCPEDTLYLPVTGYRRVAADVCSGGVALSLEPHPVACPLLPIQGLTIAMSPAAHPAVAVGQTVTFNATATQGSLLHAVYHWSVRGIAQNAVHTSTSGSTLEWTVDAPVGSVSVSVVAVNAVGADASVRSVMVLQPLTAAAAPLVVPTRAHLLDPVSFAVNFTDPSMAVDAQFVWNFHDGTPALSTSSSAVVHTFTRIAQVTPQCTITNALGSITVTSAVSVVVYGVDVIPASAVEVFYTAHQLLGQTSYYAIEISNGVLNVGVLTVTYDFGDGTSLTQGRSVNHTYITPGTHNVTVRVANAAGETLVSRAILVSGAVFIDPSAVTIARTKTIRVGSPSEFVVELASPPIGTYGYGSVTYEWDFGDGSAPAGPTVDDPSTEHVYSDVGTYTVRVTLTNEAGTTSQSSNVTVVGIGTLTTADVGVVVGSVATRGQSLVASVEYTDVSHGSAFGAVSYTFDWGDGTAVTHTTQRTAMHVYAAEGGYALRVKCVNELSTVIVSGGIVTVHNLVPYPVIAVAVPIVIAVALLLLFLWHVRRQRNSSGAYALEYSAVEQMDRMECETDDRLNASNEVVIDVEDDSPVLGRKGVPQPQLKMHSDEAEEKKQKRTGEVETEEGSPAAEALVRKLLREEEAEGEGAQKEGKKKKKKGKEAKKPKSIFDKAEEDDDDDEPVLKKGRGSVPQMGIEESSATVERERHEKKNKKKTASVPPLSFTQSNVVAAESSQVPMVRPKKTNSANTTKALVRSGRTLVMDDADDLIGPL